MKLAKKLQAVGLENILEKKDFVKIFSTAKIQKTPSGKYSFLESEINGRVFRAMLNRVGNIKSVSYWGDTDARKASEIGEYTDDVRGCLSDMGMIVINGLGFHNGYGDGHNTVVVRKFLNRPNPHAAHCRAEIYNREACTVIYPRARVQVWTHDCTPGKFVFDGEAEKIVLLGRKIWIIAK